MAEETGRITVSRDALRADMAELELRLQAFIRAELSHKADAGPVLVMANKLDALDRGDFTPVHRRALIELIQEQTAARADSAWTAKSRVMAVLSAATLVAAFALSLIAALHGVIL